MKSLQVILWVLFSAPVVAAHYFFSFDPNLLVLFTALASVGLLVFCLGPIFAGLEKGLLRTAVGSIIVSILAIYYFAQFLSYYLQGSYFNQQFYFHFNLTTVTETWSVYYPLVFLFLSWLAVLWLSFFYFRNRTGEARYPRSLIASWIIAAVILDPGIRNTALASLNTGYSPKVSSIDDVEWDNLKLNREALQNVEVQASAGKNLVFLFLEGLENIYTDESIFPGLTPNLNRLNAEGWQLENLTQVDGTGWTMGGIVASLCGTPLLYQSSILDNEILFTRYLDDATCLPDVLESANYQQVFMGGASLNFAGKGEFLRNHSFDAVLGRAKLTDALDDPSYLGAWGLFDDSLFNLAANQFEMLAEMEQPFNLTLLTVDTHHPSGQPSPSCAPYQMTDNSILDAVHCTDYLIGKFIDRLKLHPAYKNTLIVLASDHLAMRNDAYPLFKRSYERRLYFNVLNSESAESGGESSSQKLATPMDIAPTVLDLLGVEHDAEFLAGTSLLITSSDSSNRTIQASARREAIRFINSNYLSSQEEVLHYSLNQSGIEQLNFSVDIEDPSMTGAGLDFRSIGDDPYLILPELSLESVDDARLYIEFELKEASSISLYFKTDDNDAYSEQNKLSKEAERGLNQAVFRLSNSPAMSRIRIDVGTESDRTLIRSIEIRS